MKGKAFFKEHGGMPNWLSDPQIPPEARKEILEMDMIFRPELLSAKPNELDPAKLTRAEVLALTAVMVSLNKLFPGVWQADVERFEKFVKEQILPDVVRGAPELRWTNPGLLPAVH